MKKTISTFILIFIFFGCFAQRYEIWVETSDSNNKIKGNYGFSNDTILMLYSNASLLFPTKDKYFTWNEVDNLKYRNKSKNQMGQLLGAGAGFLAFELLKNSIKNSADREVFEFTSIITLPIFIGAGTLVGHLATRKKTKLPLNGMSPAGKNKALNSNIKRKK
ncbi:MAG: hypothetical protein ABFS16_16205 [Bacteroidota bacterium]